MQKILQVALREYSDTIRTKTFILGLLMVPIIIGVIVLFTGSMAQGPSGPRPPLRVSVTDLSGSAGPQILAGAETYNRDHPKGQILVRVQEAHNDAKALEAEAKVQLRQGQIDACIMLDKDAVAGSGKIHLYTYKPKPADLDRLWTVEGFAQHTVTDLRCKARNLSPEILAEVRDVAVERVDVGDTDQAQRVESRGQAGAKMMIPFFFMYLMFMGVVGMGQHLLSSIIEEKNSRIIEVLLSALSPFELMAGKILGLGAVGLSVTALWASGAYAAARWQGLTVEVTPLLIGCFVVYYVLGFLLFSSILAAIGSLCNTIKEAQSLMMPVMMVCILPMLAWFKLVQDPNGPLARGLSFVPPLTPMVMILRLTASPDIQASEVVLSILLLCAAMVGAVWAAAKVFRTGILMYGKRPGLGEVLRWLRQA
jgi:ABC-2 type transport system permease protein